MVKVDNFEGRVTDINTRYTVIRALNGRESIVPNEMLITQRVENSSLADPQVALNTTLQVAYGSELDAVLPRPAGAVHDTEWRRAHCDAALIGVKSVGLFGLQNKSIST